LTGSSKIAIERWPRLFGVRSSWPPTIASCSSKDPSHSKGNSGMFTIVAEVQVTRRQRLSHVLDDAGTVHWSGRSVVSAVEYLFENGQTIFLLEGEASGFVLKIEAAPASTETGEADTPEVHPL